MEKKLLHIANGDGLTEKLQEMEITGPVIIWREMLCEGPTAQEVGGKEFIGLREKFFKEKYKFPKIRYKKKVIGELEKLHAIHYFDEIVLWFEFDLFSHINMMAVISFLVQNEKKMPLYLVCSGRVKGEKKLLPLAELSQQQLQAHYDNKIQLNEDDIEMAILIWELYCGNKPMRMIAEIKKTTNFQYLPSCLRAHIERFPNTKTGLNALEMNILNLISNHNITSRNQLLGYALEYQGYYGYDDMQMERTIDHLKMFYDSENSSISLSEDGKKAVAKTKNFYRDLKENEWYGGAGKYDFLYDSDAHKLLKL